MIRLEHVSKSYAQPVLRDVSLQVPKGCLYGLIGPGASGKSVLLKSIVGLVKPDAGKIFVEDEEVTGLDDLQLGKLRLKFGMLFQNNALFDYMPVGDNIAFPLRRLYDLPEAEIKERVAERLARMALPGFEPRAVGGLSGGQKKRIGVARATVTRAPIVLYDEPAAGLDPVTSQKIFNLLRDEQQQTNATVVMVSSDVDRLLTVTDRVGMLLRGKLIFDGTTTEAQASTHPAVKQFIYGLDDGPL
ncbi:MAG: ATP-binding cassette domain-containing protein [Polyangiales bacterium]